MRPSLAAIVVALVASSMPAPAWACGGFACSAAAPVVQVGEQIVYVIGEDGTLTMSVRILYRGAASEFAWILPVPETPEITLGTEALFSSIEPGTRPTFTVTSRVEGTCRADPTCVYDSLAPRFGDAGAVASDAAPRLDGGGPTVFSEGAIGGPYETVVIGGASATETIDWLMARGYDIPDTMAPILDEYVAAGQRFVALRLRNDASTSDIQPVTLSFGGVLPCLPIRLTAVSTAPSLPITAYFLGAARAAPRNYSLIETPFPVSLYQGGSYTSWVAGEVTSLDGHAFATDYAGPTPRSISVSVLGDVADLADETSFDTFIGALRSRGYAADASAIGAIARGIEGGPSDTAAYVTCRLTSFGPCGPAPTSFDASAIVAELEVSVRQPRLAASAWLTERPYLTRLYTTMSAEDMTLDPEFVLDDGLGDVSNVHTAERITECNSETFLRDARVRLETDDGRVFELSPGRVSNAGELCAAAGGRLERGGCSAGRSSASSVPALAAVLALVALVVARRR